jgi:hypothetical protein
VSPCDASWATVKLLLGFGVLAPTPWQASDFLVDVRAGVGCPPCQYHGLGYGFLPHIKAIRGWMLLKNIEGAVGLIVSPLDGASRPLAEIHGRLLESGWEFEIGGIPATSCMIKVIR